MSLTVSADLLFEDGFQSWLAPNSISTRTPIVESMIRLIDRWLPPLSEADANFSMSKVVSPEDAVFIEIPVRGGQNFHGC